MGVLKAILTVSLVVLGLNSVSEAGIFNAVVPNLSSGWFAKPGPTESLIFGLMVLKVMALRLAGVFPYNLNDFWKEDGIFSDALFKRSGRVQRDLFFTKFNKFSKAPLLKEIDAVERILLGLRRIDSHDCFIRHVCQVKQNSMGARGGSEYERAVMKIFSMRPAKKAAASGDVSVWDIYHDALSPEVIDCNQKYKMCPLTKKDMKVESLLSGFF